MATCNNCGRPYRQNWTRTQPCPECRKGGAKKEPPDYVEVEADIRKVRVFRSIGIMHITYANGTTQTFHI